VENTLKEPHVNVVNDYIERLNKLGYHSDYKLTTASYYGIPQERKRVICVSILNGNHFIFPTEYEKANNLEDYIDFRPQDDLTFNFFRRYKEVKNPNATEQEFIDYINNLPISRGIGSMKMGLYSFGEMDTITTIYGQTGTLTCRNVQNYNKKYWYNNRLYKPSPRMCWRLMGFTDEDFDKASKVNDDKALYNQAGNSIVVNVLEKIINNLLK
jgi:DNA (cytosine-5)-methyltransferase 1